jgi:hypothetical protein
MKKKKPADLKSVPLKTLPLTVTGIGLTAKETEEVAEEFDAKFAKMSCCQSAATRLCLIMMRYGIEHLGTIVDIQDCANHLIKRSDDGNFSIKRQLADLMAKSEAPTQ